MSLRNRGGRYCLTFDVDWAPEIAIEGTLQILERFRAPATFFLTHHSEVINQHQSGLITKGIHPNFLSNSSHGSSVEEILAACAAFEEHPKYVRTHCLHQSSPLLETMFRVLPSLKADLSVFTWGLPLCSKMTYRLSADGPDITRLNYQWEDDVAISSSKFDSTSELLFGSTTILDFHPIHVYLNSASMVGYAALRKALGPKPLDRASREEIEPFVNPGFGVRVALERLLASENRCIDIEDLV